jgi:Domain of unknown function (DUF4387)
VKLHELATVVRSKNAGPFLVTVDVFFAERDAFDRVRASGVLEPASIAGLYGVPRADVVGAFWEPAALGAKVTLRKRPSVNDLSCGDLFGSHQHVPIAYAEIA